MAVAGNIYQLFSFQFQFNYGSLNRSVLIQQTLMNDVTNLPLGKPLLSSQQENVAKTQRGF